jgi:hypothetical protein
MVDKGSFSILRTAFSGSRYLLKKRPFYITNQDMQHSKRADDAPQKQDGMDSIKEETTHYSRIE